MSSNVTWDDHLDRHGNRPEKALWSHTSTLTLIKSVRERDVLKLRREDHNLSCAVIWGAVQEDLLNKGFSFSISQIRNKWKKLKQRYYAKSDNPSHRIWRYYDLMHEIMRSEERKTTKPRAVDVDLSLLGMGEADLARLAERNNVIFRILEKKQTDCRTVQGQELTQETAKKIEDCLQPNGLDVAVADHTFVNAEERYHSIEEKHNLIAGEEEEEEADIIIESASTPGSVAPNQEEYIPQNDGGVLDTISALIKTIKEEHEKDRIAARENQEALIVALNNVASSIQNSSRELISALHSSLT